MSPNMRATLGNALIRAWRRFRRSSTPSLFGMDAKLSRYLGFRGGFFIEAGANDGYAQSNTYFLEREMGWKGLLVEGIPDLYEKCLSNRPDALVRNCALVSSDFTGSTVVMHYASLMSVVDGSLGSAEAQDKHINVGVDVQKLGGSYEIEVPARTLESVLDEIPGLPPIDFLSLDVEGYELNVLKGLNLSKHRPAYILVEARFFDDVNALLVAASYEMVEQLSFHDYLYAAR